MGAVKDRIAFLIHTDEMFNHYKNVWIFLESKNFDIILHGGSEARERSKLKANEYGINCYESELLLINEVKWLCYLNRIEPFEHVAI